MSGFQRGQQRVGGPPGEPKASATRGGAEPDSMERKTTTPRPDWQNLVQQQGLIWEMNEHPDGSVSPYWDESVYYSFTQAEVDRLAVATDELNRMCLQAVAHVIEHKRYAELSIPHWCIERIEDSWNQDRPGIYGRFDLGYGGDDGAITMYEYNADTPTTLLEAGVIQLNWLAETHPTKNQYNVIHQKLVETWKLVAPMLEPGPVHFTWSVEDPIAEDYLTCEYIRAAAIEAGVDTRTVAIEHMVWLTQDWTFRDLNAEQIKNIFKIYPWEWIVRHDNAPLILASMNSMSWMEPIWKMVLSNKGILAILWELYPGHPLLAPAYLDGPRDMTSWVKKPLLAREGKGVEIVENGETISRVDDYGYGREGSVWQEWRPLPDFGGQRPVIGSWVIGFEPAGIGIREENGPITEADSRFIPHVVEN